MGFARRKPKWEWREYLTPDEVSVLDKAEQAKTRWLELNKERAAITNRAIQRAKYDARRAQSDDASRKREG